MAVWSGERLDNRRRRWKQKTGRRVLFGFERHTGGGAGVGEDSGEGSGGEETSGEKKTTRQEDVLDDGDRRSYGLQPVRWQVIRRKGQDELLLGSVHPYPSDEQEPKIKPRPVSSFCGWCRMVGHLWEDCPDEDKDAEELEEYWGRSKYPGKDGWRDDCSVKREPRIPGDPTPGGIRDRR